MRRTSIPARRQGQRANLPALLACATLLACTVDDATTAAESIEFRVGSALPASMASTLANLQTAATAGKAFDPQRLAEVANDYAARYEGIARGATPLGITYLKDADGKVTAMSVTYARVDDLTHPTAAALQTWIDGESVTIASSLNDDDSLPLQEIAGLRVSDEYLNVIVGASVQQPRLLSMTDGLPVQVYEQLGRRRIAAELGVALGSVSAGTAFFEPTLDRASRLGLRYQVSGKGPHLYFVPDGGSALGMVVPAAAFAPVRSEAISAYTASLAAKLERPANTPLPRLLELEHARQWGRTFALLDAIAGSARPFPCSNCSALSLTQFDLGVLDLHDWLFADDDDDCTCTERYQDGSEQVVSDCGAMDCCELDDGEFPAGQNCLLDCTCDCEAQEWETIHYDHLLRGVPNLFQQDVTVPWSPVCSGTVAVGCGAIAAAELAVWYDMLGHDELLDHHHDTNGLFLWQDLSEELRNDYLDSHCIGRATWTTQADLAAGIFDYFWDQGVATSVVHDVVEIADEASAWVTIENEIAANRPLILGLNATAGAALGQGLINHYAVIVGHSTTVGTDEIHLNMGWGFGSSEIMEWDLVGQVHLYSVEIADAPTGNEECTADTPLDDLFAEDPWSLDWSASSWTYDDYPVVEHLTGTAAPDCDRIGGITEGWFDANWTEASHCLTPHDVDVIDQQYQDFEEELNDGSIPDWIWE
jgi:hypothetical protein